MKNKRYVRFFGFGASNTIHIGEKYGLKCTRSWWGCLKLGIRHILKGNAIFFVILKNKPKKSSHSH